VSQNGRSQLTNTHPAYSTDSNAPPRDRWWLSGGGGTAGALLRWKPLGGAIGVDCGMHNSFLVGVGSVGVSVGPDLR
jgi:hypothetical protein